MEKNCLQCNKIIHKKQNCSMKAWNERVRYCSKVCLNQSKIGITLINSGSFKKGYINYVPVEKRAHGDKNPKWKGGQIKKICITCKTEFLVDPYLKDSKKNCSKVCSNIYRRTEEFRLTLSEIQRSALPQHQKDLTKLLTDFRDIIRNSARYKLWHQAVMKRDNYTCQMCGVKSSKEHRLQVDHIKSFAEIVRDEKITNHIEAYGCKILWGTDNGRTLCHPCHKTTPSYGWKSLKLLSENN